MKSRIIPMVAVLTALAAPALAQIADTPSAETGATVRPVPTSPGRIPAHDPEVEVAFWETVKDSGDPMLYLAYLEQFPDGAFRVIARNRLDALWQRALLAFTRLDEMGVSLDEPSGGRVPPVATPAPGPVVSPPIVVAPTPQPPEAPSWRLTRNTQNQLRKHGCYKGALDGVWGAGSRTAMKRFNRRAGTSYSVLRPTSKAIKFMRDLTKSGVRICR